MKQIFLVTAFLLVSAYSWAQAAKGTPAKTTTKVKTTTVKPAAPKGETEEQKKIRLEKIDAKARAMTATMAKHINLSLEQQVEVNRINRSSISQVESARIRYIKNLKKMNEIIKNVSSSRLSLLKDVLTPEQFAAYNQKREEKMGIPKMDEQPKAPVQGYDQ